MEISARCYECGREFEQPSERSNMRCPSCRGQWRSITVSVLKVMQNWFERADAHIHCGRECNSKTNFGKCDCAAPEIRGEARVIYRKITDILAAQDEGIWFPSREEAAEHWYKERETTAEELTAGPDVTAEDMEHCYTSPDNLHHFSESPGKKTCIHCGIKEEISGGKWDIPNFKYSFWQVSESIHRWAKSKGFWDKERNNAECIALMHSELSEALEAIRHNDPPDEHCPEFSSVEIELADCVIRIMDFSFARQLRVGEAIEAKMNYNEGRERKHGKEF